MVDTSLDIVIPVYNEEAAVVRETLNALMEAFGDCCTYKVILVDDGSDEHYGLSALAGLERVTYIRHEVNRGYGAALKTGIRKGTAPYIAITDADGTYPVADLPAMYRLMDQQDMVVGARTGDIREIPLLRRIPKAALNAFASYMAGVRVPDLNSGLRIFRRDLCELYWSLLPNGFSFTSTMTMGAALGGYRLCYQTIDYYKRAGKSSIKPIQDTIRFFTIVSRLGMMFAPLKIFVPVAMLLFAVGVTKGFVIDYAHQGYVGNASVMVMMSGLQVFMMGLLGEVVVRSRLVQAARR